MSHNSERNLTPADIQYLSGRQAEYRVQPSREKAAFREDCAKHLLSVRNIPDTNTYALEWFKKVCASSARAASM